MSQIFKQIPDINLLFNLIKNENSLDNSYYIINKSLYKKLLMNNSLNEFIEILTPFYYKSKQFYAKKNPTYKNFLTIIRQLCNCNKIYFYYYIHYQNSSYETIYKISKNI